MHEEDRIPLSLSGLIARIALTVVVGAFLGFALASLVGCRLPPPETTPGKLINCTTEEVAKNWPTVLPAVNTCLTRPDGADWRGCLDLIPAAVKVGSGVLACVLRYQETAYASAADQNPSDSRSARAAARANLYISEKGYTFE